MRAPLAHQPLERVDDGLRGRVLQQHLFHPQPLQLRHVLVRQEAALGLELAAKRKASGQSLPAGATPDRSTLLWYRLLVGASHTPLLAAFIFKASGGDPGPGALWTAAFLPLVSFAGLLIRSQKSQLWWLPSKSSATRQSPPPDGPGEAVPRQGQVPDKWSLLCRSILAFGSAALLSLVALWFFHRLYRGESAEVVPGLVSLLLLCTLVVIVTNLVVSVLFHKHPRKALLASFFAALLLLGAFMTAFYTFRLVFLAFLGAPRMSREAAHHIHESPPVMTYPLIVLAVGSVLAGFIALPIGYDGIGSFLFHTFAAAFIPPPIAPHAMSRMRTYAASRARCAPT